MFARCILMTGVLAAAILIANCNDDSTGPESNTDPLAELKARLAQTPRLSREAEEMALWLSGELVAPEWLYLHCDSAVNRLRNQYDRGAPSGLNTTFFRMSPQPSDIWVFYDSASSAAINQGSYIVWDSLNALYRATVVRVYETDDSIKSVVNLKSVGRLNSDSLASYYTDLPGVDFAENGGNYSNGPNLYPFIHEGQMRFLLHEAWGDCPSGCLVNFLTYYRDEVDSFHTLGTVFLSDTTQYP
ncbi:MAG: hypothetical protein ABIJ61_06925, partial [bacterium]